MSTLILIRGNSGSGKTTLARRLQQRLGLNTMRLSQDMIRREILWVRDGPDTPALPLLTLLLDYGRRNSQHVILEGILDARVYQPLFAASGAFDRRFAYYYDLPFEETLRRHRTRPQCQEFGPEAMARWFREKDFLPDIAETIFDQTVTLEQAEARILGDLGLEITAE